MKYRKFGKNGTDTSVFGIGCMRLPLKNGEDESKIDEAEAIRMIRYAIDSGVNYVDTAYPYHGGESEPLVGKALQDGYRERTKLATKSPVWKVEQYEDFEKFLDEQLEKLQTDYVDFYLLHALSIERWEKMKKLNALAFLDEMKKKGKIKNAGFSFHDNYPTFKTIVDAYDWDMCQIQLNYLDQEYQAGVKGLQYASRKGIPVVVMEPLQGGKLAQIPSQDIMELWKSYDEKRSPVEWAFKWLYNFPEVNVILSGVSNMEQLKENIELFDSAEADTMSEEELKLVDKVRDLYREKIMVPCTGCDYCKPCPEGVAISTVFELYNEAVMYDKKEKNARMYNDFLIKNNKDASQCVECGNCESACPQNIAIIEELKNAHKYLTA